MAAEVTILVLREPGADPALPLPEYQTQGSAGAVSSSLRQPAASTRLEASVTAHAVRNPEVLASRIGRFYCIGAPRARGLTR